jgi:cytochrome c oxidase assembly protein subunit 15
MDSILEYAHRVLAGITSLFIVAAALVGWRRARHAPWVRWPLVIAVVFLAAVIFFGAMVVLRGLGPGLSALDLGSALVVLGLMLIAAVVAGHKRHGSDLPIHLSFRGPFARLTLWTMIAVFVVFISGVLVATSGSVVRCLSWPLYGGPWRLDDVRGWLLLARGVLSGVAGILILYVVVQAWRLPAQAWAVRSTAALAGLLLLAELLIGALGQAFGAPLWLQVAYVAVAAALWVAVVALVALASLTPK